MRNSLRFKFKFHTKRHPLTYRENGEKDAEGNENKCDKIAEGGECERHFGRRFTQRTRPAKFSVEIQSVWWKH